MSDCDSVIMKCDCWVFLYWWIIIVLVCVVEC